MQKGLIQNYCDLKFTYSEKATKFFKISNLNLSSVVTVKSTVEILQNFVAFSEYMNLKSIAVCRVGNKFQKQYVSKNIYCTRTISIDRLYIS